MATQSPECITFEEYLACSRITFEWANSYDMKDWDRLQQILSPVLQVDYSAVMGPGKQWSEMPAKDFVAMMSNPTQLGNPLIATQHLIGGSSWERTGSDEVTGTHQLRAAHQRYEAEETGGRSKVVLAKGHGHAIIKHLYKKEKGLWKLAGLQPSVIFDEGSVKDVFS